MITTDISLLLSFIQHPVKFCFCGKHWSAHETEVSRPLQCFFWLGQELFTSLGVLVESGALLISFISIDAIMMITVAITNDTIMMTAAVITNDTIMLIIIP